MSLVSDRSEEHTSELQSRLHLVCRLLLEKKKSGQASCPRTRLSQHPDALLRCSPRGLRRHKTRDRARCKQFVLLYRDPIFLFFLKQRPPPVLHPFPPPASSAF